MRTTKPYPWRSPGLLTSAASWLSASAAPGWAQVHAQLASQPWPGCSLPEAGALTLYHYCVAKATGHAAPEAARAQAWLAQMLAQMHSLPARSWSAACLDQACLLAWLSADGLAVAPALLAELDHKLGQQGQEWAVHATAAGRQFFFQVLRYFSLRLPDPAAQSVLRILLAAWPGTLPPAPARLSLVGGTAAELLVCVRLAKADKNLATLVPYVREGVRHLLATRRPVDSSQQHDSVFPDTTSHSESAPSFSAELSWRRGDLGQALLLYEAHALLRDPELAKFADLVGLHTLLRTTASATETRGTSLYQGTAGVAHLYRQLYRQSRQPAYLNGYEFWLAATTSQLVAVAHSAAAPADPLRYGLVGTGLVLLSASTKQELYWEEALLGAK